MTRSPCGRYLVNVVALPVDREQLEQVASSSYVQHADGSTAPFMLPECLPRLHVGVVLGLS